MEDTFLWRASTRCVQTPKHTASHPPTHSCHPCHPHQATRATHPEHHQSGNEREKYINGRGRQQNRRSKTKRVFRKYALFSQSYGDFISQPFSVAMHFMNFLKKHFYFPLVLFFHFWNDPFRWFHPFSHLTGTFNRALNQNGPVIDSSLKY